MGLRQYLARRIFDSIIVVFLILILNFFFFYVRLPEASNLPILQQFSDYVRFLFIDFSTVSPKAGVIPQIISNLPFTLFLLGSSIALAIGISLLLGGFAAYRPKSKITAYLALILISLFLVPSWWLSLFFTHYLSPYFPLGHWYSTKVWAYSSAWANPLGFIQDVLWHMFLPVISLTLSVVGVYFLVVRNSMKKFMNEPFIVTAKAKGVSTRKIIFKHIFRNAILPITAIAALTPIIMINAVIPIERAYSLTGTGYFFYWSMISPQGFTRDAPDPLVQILFLMLALITVVIQFVFDIAHHFLDPRLKIDGGQLESAKRTRKLRLSGIWKRFIEKKSGIVGLTIILLFVAIAILAPFLPLHDPEEFILLGESTPPSMMSPLGTDNYGRDVLSRLIWASRVSLAEFFGALCIALSIGYIVGLLAGYYDGKWFSYILDRITDVFVAIPMLMLIAFFPLEPGFPKWILSAGIATWGITAKTLKSQVITIKERPYIEAAKAAGASNRHVLLNYILPEAFSIVASTVVYTAALIISLQSSLDFFGFRRLTWSRIEEVKTPPVLTWGSLLSYSNTTFLASDAWWTVLPPIICMCLLGLSIVFLTDAIANALNPQLSSREIKKESSKLRQLFRKLKRHKLAVFAVLMTIILVVTLIIFPTPHNRIRNESRSDLEKWLGCYGTLNDNNYWRWNLTNLDANLRIVVNISSIEEVYVYIKSVEGEVSNNLGEVHDYTVNASGPSLYVNIDNPVILGSGSPAIISGDITIYHDYETQVSYTEWLQWWMP
jgi:peptide/nickel transport system permease protein